MLEPGYLGLFAVSVCSWRGGDTFALAFEARFDGARKLETPDFYHELRVKPAGGSVKN